MTTSRIPKGCDQQGRYPEAAECCTELGQDDPDFYGPGYWKEEAVNLIIFAAALVAIMGTLALFFAG
jgi:hypothetical protein